MKESLQASVIAPYGTWTSPLSAAEVHAGAAPIFDARFRGEHIYYSTKVPQENSRTSLVRTSLSHPQSRELMVPAGFNVRSAVHEYGGTAWALDPDSEVIYFVNASDQRIWQLIPGRAPHALTPETSGLVRHGDLVMTRWGLLCIREDKRSTLIQRQIILMSRHGTTKVLADHAHFMAWPRLSPDGSTLAFIGWEHPNMPWDSTTLWIVDVASAHTSVGSGMGQVRGVLPGVLDGRDVSLLQPEFVTDRSLLLCSDHGGRWSLYGLDLAEVVGLSGADVVELGPSDLLPVLETKGEIGGPLWQLGEKWYVCDETEIWAHTQAAGARLICASASANEGDAPYESFDGLVGAEPVVGTHGPVGLKGHSAEFATIELHDLSATHVLFTERSARHPGRLIALERSTGAFNEVARERLDTHHEYFSGPRAEVLGGVPVVIHPPHNPRFTALDREKPPYVVVIHGGPTGQSTPAMSARNSYFTSRGIGVMEVNHGGSTGFGREWRDRLKGQWGIVDVDDTVAAVRGLVEAGLADPQRIAISGASAGGWTVLSALASSEDFACGTSYFGVTDLMKFSVDTHDFERHYIDGLVGPWPEATDEYLARSPIYRVTEITDPVAIMQGDRDPIVPPSQAQEFVDRLEYLGREYIYRVYKGESHGFVRADSIIDSLESEFGFYADVFSIPRTRRHS